MENLATNYGYINDGKVFLKGYMEYPDRQIGVVKESEQASIEYFEKRYFHAKQKVEELEKLVETSQNKGSFLMKLIHMKDYLAKYDGLGDFPQLFAKLDTLEVYLDRLIKENRKKNYDIKKELLVEAEQLAERDDFLEATEDAKELKMKWIKTGAVEDEHKEEIEDRFDDLIRQFFKNKKDFFKDRNQEIKGNLRGYRNILYKADSIRDSDDFENAFIEFRELQNRWKEAGKVPHKKAVTLWEKFRRTNDFFFNRFKLYKSYKTEYPDLDSTQIKEKLQTEYFQEAVKIEKSRITKTSTDRAKELLIDWKKLSKTFCYLDENISLGFRNACDRIFENSYLIRVIKRKYPYFEDKPKEDKYRIQVSFMRELIRRDEAEIQAAESNLRKMAYNKNKRYNRRLAFKEQRQAENNLNVQKRKHKVKKQILRELEETLSSIRS